MLPPHMKGLGGLPFPAPWPHPDARPPSPADKSVGYPCEAADQGPLLEELEEELKKEQDPSLVVSRGMVRAARRAIWTTHPSPLEAKPYHGRVEELTARVVIAPPTSPGNAAATTGAAAIAAAEQAISGETINVLTPDDTGDFVDVLTYEIGPSRAYTVYSIGAWAHDYLASRDVIRWKVTISSDVIVDERELGILGGMDNPVKVAALIRPHQKLVIQAKNLDANSASLVEVRVHGWSFPLVSSDDSFFSLINPPVGPEAQGRFE